MPIYEYACKACGFEKDALQKMSDEPLTQCPECKEESFIKKMSAPGFRLKGGGWYETDFKSGKKKNLATGTESSNGSDTKAPSPKAGTKPVANKSSASKTA